MAVETEPKANEAQIAVHWKEEDYVHPSAAVHRAGQPGRSRARRAVQRREFPGMLQGIRRPARAGISYWHTTLDTSNPPFWKWFVGGKLNACYNCVDRHLAKYKNKAALIFVPEPEEEHGYTVTYQELFMRVNEVAAVLRDFCGLKRATASRSTCR